MRLGFEEAWAGMKGKTAVCPHCRSPRVRYSRRHYEGFWFFLFKVRPMKCSDCGAYFPIAPNAAVWSPKGDPADLHLPFTPSEMDGPAEPLLGPSSLRPESTVRSGWGRVSCPACGSASVRSAHSGIGSAARFRLGAKDLYRCVDCNASFGRTNLLKLLVAVLLLAALAWGVAYLVSAFRGGPPDAKASPRIRGNELPKVPPPVFR